MNKYKIEEILSNIQFQVYSDMNFIEPLELDKETWKELLEYINKQKEVIDKIKEYINKNCVNQKISKEVGYKCFTMADTQELEHIWNLLEEIE